MQVIFQICRTYRFFWVSSLDWHGMTSKAAGFDRAGERSALSVRSVTCWIQARRGKKISPDFPPQVIMLICRFIWCFHVYISRTRFCTNHLQPVALHGLFQVRKGLEKLNGKTAEYQKWLKDRWTVSPLRWLCAAQLASLMVGCQVEMLVSLMISLKRERRKGSWQTLWVFATCCCTNSRAHEPDTPFLRRKWSNRSTNKWWRRRPATRILLPLWESHRTFFLSVNDGDMPRIQPALAFATEYIRTRGSSVPSITCK